jgi:LacI family repressor for deo operon, udp, cdd, tsx, nupC, and nupG
MRGSFPAVAPRLAEVAGLAGVSQATASRVLSGKPGVSPVTRDAVLAAAESLGYKRTTASPSDRLLIGVIVQELENPIFASFAQHITTLLGRAGHTPMLGTQTAVGISEDEWVRMVLERGGAGIIFVSGIHADTHANVERYERLRAQRIPMVMVNGYLEGTDAICISDDDRTAMSLAVDHLVSLGHRRIGLAVGPERYTPVVRKLAGFHAALDAHGLDGESLVMHTLFTLEGGRAAALALLDRGATAIVCASDLMAFGAMRACSARRLSVPRDVSIVGYDDSAVAAFTGPTLTTVRQAVAEMSKAAARMLLDEIAGKHAHRHEYLFQPELVVRASTGAAPGERPPAPARKGRRLMQTD